MPNKEFSRHFSRRSILKVGVATFLEIALASCSSANENLLNYNKELKIRAEMELKKSYETWKNTYVFTQRETAKVVRIDQGNDEVSEGIGYGLILAAHMEDKDLVNGLWNEAKKHFNKNGLMSWQVKSDGSVPDPNSATDADMDIAYGLLVADKNDEAVKLINTIFEKEVEVGTFVLKPGDAWGGSSVTAPSYFSPAYFDIFARVTNNSKWNSVTTKCQEIIDKAQENMGGIQTGLVPDWCTAEGKTASGQSYNYGYNACRYPWRQAMALTMNTSDPSTISHTREQVTKINNFIAKVSPDKIVDGYTVDGKPIGKYHNTAFIGPFATATLGSSNHKFQQFIFQELIKTTPDSYFSHSLQALSFLLLSGKMKA